MKKIYMIAGGGLALVLIISAMVIVVSLNSGDKGQKPGTEQTQEQTNETVSSQGKKDETEIIGDDTPLPGETDTDKADANKTEDKGSAEQPGGGERSESGEQPGNGEQPGGEEQAGNGDQPGSEEQPEGGDQPEGPVELPFVPYS